MTELMYEVPSDPTISKVVVTPDSVLKKGKPIVEHGWPRGWMRPPGSWRQQVRKVRPGRLRSRI